MASRCLAALLLSALTFAGACGDDDDDTLRPIVCPAAPAAPDPCDGRECFTACGAPIVVGALPEGVALAPSLLPDHRPVTAQRLDGRLVAAVPWGIRVLVGDEAAVAGSLPLAGGPAAVAVVAGRAWVGAEEGNIVLLDVSDPAQPVATATWRTPGGVELVGGSSARLILRTPEGIAVINVNDPAEPIEERCLTVPGGGGMESVWHIAAAVRTVVAAGGSPPAAFVFDLERPESVPASVPIDAQTSVVLHGGRLLVTHNGQAVLYQVASGAPLSEMARADFAPGWMPTIAGGFLLDGASAYDLDAHLERFDVVPSDPGSCAIGLNALDRERSWIIAPGIAPDRRFDPALAPTFVCPPATDPVRGAQSAAVSPDGEEVLVGLGGDALLLRLDTGAVSASPALPGDVAWLEPWLVAVAATEDGGALGSRLTFVSADDPTGTPTTVDRGVPLVSWAVAAGRVVLLEEAAPRGAGDPSPDPEGHRAVTFALPATAAAPLELPDVPAPIALAGHGGHLWVLDARREVVRFEVASGERVDTALPFDADPGSLVAGPLGLAFRDGCGALAWIDVSGRLSQVAPGQDWTPLAVGSDHLAVVGDAAPAGAAGEPSLLIVVPGGDGDGGLTWSIAGRYPLSSGAALAVFGASVGVLQAGLHGLAMP